jgi:hypothetical protein
MEALLSPVILRSPGTEIVVCVMQTLADTGDFEYGWRAVVEAATILIPRTLLPTKIEPAGPRFGAQFFRDYLYWRAGNVSPMFTGGWSPTTLGYFYWQFGWPGVLLGMLLLGIATKAAYHYVRVNPQDRTRMLLYTTFMSSFPYFAESPQDALNGLVIRMFFAVGFLILLTARRGPSP